MPGSVKPGPLPGYRTFVTPESDLNIPGDVMPRKEQALPPGSATPGGVTGEAEESEVEGDRVMPQFEYNTPDTGSNIVDRQQRSLAPPGQTHGESYSIYDKSMGQHSVYARVADAWLAALLGEGGRIKEGYKSRWRPGKRQTRSRGRDKQKRRQRYRRKMEDFDLNLIFGEVNEPDPVGKEAGDTFVWDKYDDVADAERMDTDDARRRWRADPPAGGHPGPNKHPGQANPPTSRVVPDGLDGMVRAAATIDDIASRTAEDVHQNARKVPIRMKRADPARGNWTFTAQGSKGTYTVKLKGEKKGNVKKLTKAKVYVSCDCPYFRWQGPEHWAKKNGYLLGKPRGTASKPDVKDPKGKHWACKHVLAALNLARNYRFGSVYAQEFDILPDYEVSRRVAARWLKARS